MRVVVLALLAALVVLGAGPRLARALGPHAERRSLALGLADRTSSGPGRPEWRICPPNEACAVAGHRPPRRAGRDGPRHHLRVRLHRSARRSERAQPGVAGARRRWSPRRASTVTCESAAARVRRPPVVGRLGRRVQQRVRLRLSGDRAHRLRAARPGGYRDAPRGRCWSATPGGTSTPSSPAARVTVTRSSSSDPVPAGPSPLPTARPLVAISAPAGPVAGPPETTTVTIVEQRPPERHAAAARAAPRARA